TMPENEAIDGEVNWSGELGPVWDLFSPFEDRFTGPGEIALALAGNLGNPSISGYFQVLGGRYDNLQSATTLVDVNLRLASDGDKLVLERLTAGDGKTGSLVGSGSIDLIPAQSYPIHLRLEFSDMRLVARDDVTLNASGNLALEGTLSNALLNGEIVTGQSELSLAGTLPPSVVELDVDEINVTSAKHARPTPAANTTNPSTIVLDLKITVPGRAFVRGLGLESEWKGDVKISGPTNAPRLAGVLSPVRGRFFLMGKSFRLEHGAIRFTGSENIDPLLDLTAEHKAPGLTALVRVTGSASKPRILLTSRPPLPESEIASQVLFGTNSSNLTTAQSLQLASAIATYSGTGGAIGILDATRRVLGVDVISFSESEENPEKTRVGVGKYVTEGVYIEIEGGAEKDSRASTTIEVEVLPNVRVQGGTTETGGNTVGIKWKWDY
ncbi:MAG: translocation/assembly module TamB, partial [Gammaproteobacteria bacterium]|nr:translocation/assembly module TamB [Gammaproteobacteria bacterium]